MPRFHWPWSRFPDLAVETDVVPARSRWRAWLGAGAVVLAILVAAAVWLAPKFERQLAMRSLREAQEMMRQQDYRRAQLMLEQAVQTNPGDSETRRQLAKFYEEVGSARALPTWKTLAQLAPGDDANQLGLGLCAVRLGDLATAREAAEAVSAAGRGTVEYHQLAAGIALRAGNQAVLDSEIAELATLEPDNARAQFNHAAIQLTGGSPAAADGARKELVELARGKPLRIRATLELMRAAQREGTPFAALAEKILPARPGVSAFVAWAMAPRGFFDLIVYMQSQENPEPEDAVVLADWLRRQGLAPEAAFWLGTLNASTLADPAVVSVRASCFVQTHDWRGLSNALRQGAWGRMSDDAVNLAMAARLQRDRGYADHARQTWNDALEVANGSFETLRALLRLAEELNWPAEAEATLQRVVQVNPRMPGAWQALAAIAMGTGATEKLLEIDTAWAKARPDEAAARSSQVWVAALLGRVTPEGASNGKYLDAPAFAAARALTLRTSGRGDQAWDLLTRLPAIAQNDPHVALVRGLLLADRGQPAESGQALAIAGSGPILLPEESALLQEARVRNGQR